MVNCMLHVQCNSDMRVCAQYVPRASALMPPYAWRDGLHTCTPHVFRTRYACARLCAPGQRGLIGIAWPRSPQWLCGFRYWFGLDGPAGLAPPAGLAGSAGPTRLAGLAGLPGPAGLAGRAGGRTCTVDVQSTYNQHTVNIQSTHSQHKLFSIVFLEET